MQIELSLNARQSLDQLAGGGKEQVRQWLSVVEKPAANFEWLMVSPAVRGDEEECGKRGGDAHCDIVYDFHVK